MPTTETRAAVVAKEAKAGEQEIQRSAVINPYALAELVAGRRIEWKQVEDAPRLLEELLQTPYEQLFDPKYDSPLYLGFRLNDELALERVAVELPEVQQDAGNDLEHFPDGVGAIGRLADLGPMFKPRTSGRSSSSEPTCGRTRSTFGSGSATRCAGSGWPGSSRAT
jgi:hypothetical protein